MANQSKQANQLLLSANSTETLENKTIAGVSESVDGSRIAPNKTVPLTSVQPLPYQAEQQTKLLNLQSDVESLLARLKTIERERLATKLESAIQDPGD